MLFCNTIFWFLTGREKFNLHDYEEDNIKVVLYDDGMEVDSDSFLFLDPNTSIMILQGNEIWSPPLPPLNGKFTYISSTCFIWLHIFVDVNWYSTCQLLSTITIMIHILYWPHMYGIKSPAHHITNLSNWLSSWVVFRLACLQNLVSSSYFH